MFFVGSLGLLAMSTNSFSVLIPGSLDLQLSKFCSHFTISLSFPGFYCKGYTQIKVLEIPYPGWG